MGELFLLSYMKRGGLINGVFIGSIAMAQIVEQPVFLLLLLC